jgi:hypothetical protein
MMRLVCRKFEIVKRTPKGVWIKLPMSNQKFILLNAHRRFACPTKMEAIQSCRARKNKYNRILQGKIDYNNRVLIACDQESSRITKEQEDADRKRKAAEDPSQQSQGSSPSLQEDREAVERTQIEDGGYQI